MKKIICYAIFLFILILSFSACNTNDLYSKESSDLSDVRGDNVPMSPQLSSAPSEQVSDVFLPSPQASYAPNEALAGGEFNNTIVGYSLTFPTEWSGYYDVDIDEQGNITIYFIGRSRSFSSQLSHDSDRVGVQVFYVVNEETLSTWVLDSPYKVGTVNGIDYYFATGTSAAFTFPYGPTEDYFNENHVLNNTNDSLYNEDNEKAYNMFKQIPEILQSFKASNS